MQDIFFSFDNCFTGVWFLTPEDLSFVLSTINRGFPHSSVGKESACSAGDPGSIPGSGRSPEDETVYPLLAWRIPWTVVPGVEKSRTQLSHFHFLFADIKIKFD